MPDHLHLLIEDKNQHKLIKQILGCCRYVYNYFLTVRKEAYQKDKTKITYTKSSGLMTVLKQDVEHLWMNTADSIALQQSLRDLDTAYQNFFKGRSGYSKYKSKHNHKQSTKLCRENQIIAVETLKVKDLLKNHKLARAIIDVSWGEFFRQLAYKSALYGCDLIKVPTFYPSSQTCSHCWNILRMSNEDIHKIELQHGKLSLDTMNIVKLQNEILEIF